jgi:transcriptional regulator with XRE-family HTH domain
MGQQPAATLGERLRDLRRQRGLSIRKLAAELGCSPSHISQFERGISEPSIGLLTELAATLDVSIDALFPRPAGLRATPPDKLVRRAHLRPEHKVGPGVRAQQLLPADDDAVGFREYIYEPGAAAPLAASGRHYGVVTEGTLNIEFDDQVVTLREGDSIAIDAAAAHLLRNRSLAPARVIWFSIDG